MFLYKLNVHVIYRSYNIEYQDFCLQNTGTWFKNTRMNVIFGLTCLVVTSMLVMGAPLWSLMTRTVIPVVGLLTAISPSLPPDIIILPVNEEYLE